MKVFLLIFSMMALVFSAQAETVSGKTAIQGAGLCVGEDCSLAEDKQNTSKTYTEAVTFSGNTATGLGTSERGAYGGGIYNSANGTVTFNQKATFTGNKAEFTDGQLNAATALHAGGSAVYNKGKMIFSGEAEFLNNQSNTTRATNPSMQSVAGALLTANNSSTTFNKKATFKNNSATSNNNTALGGAIFNKGIISFASGSEFDSNVADLGGAVENMGQITFTGTNIFKNNTANILAGAIRNVGNATINFTGSAEFTGNKALQNAGGAVFNYQNGTITFNGGATFANNSANNHGGAILNQGTMLLNGSNITFTGNTAAQGSAIYNNETGVLTFNSFQDDLVSENTNQQSSEPTGHVTFGESQTIYNAGTLNIENSKLNLHNGINTDSGISNRKVGKVNLKKSTVDLGGTGLDGNPLTGDAVLYADTVDIGAGSSLLSRVGRLNNGVQSVDDKYGRVSANNVSISSDNTKLSLVLPYKYKLKETDTGETRDYTIVDAGSISGEFANAYNAYYAVHKLGNGKYRLTTKDNCGTGMHYDVATDQCKCNDGLVPDSSNSGCAAKKECGSEATWQEGNTCQCNMANADWSNQVCTCKTGFVKVGSECQVSKEGTCKGAETYHGDTNTCTCDSPNVQVGGVCQVKTDCKENETYHGDTNTCTCDSPNVKVGNECQVSKEDTCKGAETYHSDTNTCTCDSPNVQVGGVCQVKTDCKENETYHEEDNTCKCEGDYETVDALCMRKCVGGKIRSGQLCVCPGGYEENSEGVCQVKKKDYCENCDKNEKATAEGWLSGTEITENELAGHIQNDLFEKYQEEGASDSYREALDALAPDVSPLIEAHALEITRRLATIVSERFYNSNERTGYVHHNYRFYNFPRHQSNLWAQGMYGRSKYNVRKGFDMDSSGFAIGFDGAVSDAVQMGLSYAYTNFDGTSVGQRNTEINSHTGMIYGSYNPNRFYANWMGLYTRSKFEEENPVLSYMVNADYSVDVLAAQVMLGRKMGPYVAGDWASGVIKPEIGARYIFTKRHKYTDTAGQTVSATDDTTLTGILGMQYSFVSSLGRRISWYPSLRAALTYDFITPGSNWGVTLANNSHYVVSLERNDERVGVEIGAKIGVDIDNTTELGIEYEGLFKGDYTNHTGLASVKYKF